MIQLPSEELVFNRLAGADYAFLDRDNVLEGIERCSIGNFIQKVFSKELESQMVKCSQLYNRVILLVEGVYDEVEDFLAVHKESKMGYYRTRIYPHTRYTYVVAVLVALSDMGIEILYSPNFSCTMTTIRIIYQQRTKSEEDLRLFKSMRKVKIPTKLTANPAVPRLLALCPRLGERAGLQLINKYGSIWAILNTPDTELLTSKGFGKGLLEKLKESVGKE